MVPKRPAKKEELKTVGCFVVRGVVSKNEATEWYHQLKGYVAGNKESVTGSWHSIFIPLQIYQHHLSSSMLKMSNLTSAHPGWPAPPIMFNVYHSPVQQAARSHPNELAVQRAINSLWHDISGSTSPEPLSYADGFRIRAPKSQFFGLPPHIGTYMGS
jgi:hypothetical protein